MEEAKPNPKISFTANKVQPLCCRCGYEATGISVLRQVKEMLMKEEIQ